MIIIIEADSTYCGFGIEWLDTVKGIRLGFLAIHFMSSDNFKKLVDTP